MQVHSCHHTIDSLPFSFDGNGQAAPRPRARPDVLTVDMHCHLATPPVEALVAEHPGKQRDTESRLLTWGQESIARDGARMPELIPKLTNLDVRLHDMNAMAIDVQTLSPSPLQYYYWAEPALARDIVATQNENIANACAQHPTRFIGLGTVALQHPELACGQLVDAVERLGLRGVQISTSLEATELSDPSLESFWQVAEQLGVVVFLHPVGTTSMGDRLSRHFFINVVGQPLETTLALSFLIFDGVLDRHPELKICAAHGGGYLASYWGRSDYAHLVRAEAQGMQANPSEYLQRIFFDSLVFSTDGLRHLVNQVGASQVVIGTDYPFDMGEDDPVGFIEAVPDLNDDERAAMLGGNACRLLRIDELAFRT